MAHRFLIIWASAASVLSLALLAYMFGAASAERAATAQGNVDPARTATDGQAQQPIYSVPDSFIDIATEWRSANAESLDHGYAVLFKPLAQQVIVERCVPMSYFKNGKPVTIQPDFCTAVLAGTVLSITPTQAIVRDRLGNQVKVNLQLHHNQQSLTMAFAEHELSLIPGSRNNLLQVFEQRPDVKQQRLDAHAYEAAQVEAQLSARRANTPTDSQDEAPTMTPAAMEAEEQRRAQERAEQTANDLQMAEADRPPAAGQEILRYELSKPLPHTESD